MPAPGPHDRPLQYVDGRDIADWALGSRPVGTFNTVSEPGHTTIGALLDEARTVTRVDAELVWLDPATVEAAGVAAVDRAADLGAADRRARRPALARHLPPRRRAGLRCRPMPETVADTWAWLQREGLPERPTNRGGGPMDAAAEARLWAIHDATPEELY